MRGKKLLIVLVVLILTTLACLGSSGNQNAPANEPNTGPGEVEPVEPEPTEVPVEEPTEAPAEEEPAAEEPAEEGPAAPEGFATLETEYFSISYPEDWYGEAMFGLAFIATDASLQETWFNSEGPPAVPEGALVIVAAGTLEDMDISPGVSAVEAFETALDDEEGCTPFVNLTEHTINGFDAATAETTCLSETGEEMDITSTVVLNEDQAAVILSIAAADTASEMRPIIDAIVSSFTFK